MRSARIKIAALVAVLIMVVIPLASAIPGQSDAAFDDQGYYKYVINYTNDTINSVDIYTTKGGSATHITDSKNSIWNFNSEGYGPFNSFYAAVNIDGENAGKMAFILDPDNLAKKIDGTTFDKSAYNIVWVIPTVYWKVSGSSLILTNDSTESGVQAYAHKIGGEVRKYIGIGVYLASGDTSHGGNYLMSQSGKSPKTNMTVANFDSWAHNTPGNTMLWNFYQWTFTKMATYMVGMGKNSQKIWGAGFSDSNPQKKTGYSDELGPYYGSSTGVKVFIENSWGFKTQWLGDTMLTKDRKLYAGQNATCSYDNITSGRNALSTVPSTSEKWRWIETTRTGAAEWDVPASITSTDNHNRSDRVGDQMMSYTGNSKGYVVLVGGVSGDGVGVAHFNPSNGPTAGSSYDRVSSRLAYYFDSGLNEVTISQGEHGTTTLGTKTGDQAITTTKYGKTTEVTFKNTPASGYRLKSVEVCKQGEESTKVTLTEKTLTSGKFMMPSYAVVIKPVYEPIKALSFSGDNGSISITCNGVATASPISVANAATINVSTTSSQGTMTITDTILPTDDTPFKIVNTYIVTATPDTNYFLRDFKDASSVTIPASTTVGDISGSSVTADFFHYVVTVNSGSGGSVTPSVSYYKGGEVVTLTANPSEDHRLRTITGVSGPSTPLVFLTKTLTTSTFTMPTEDVTITATFEDTKTLAITADEHGSISITGGSSPLTASTAATIHVPSNSVDSGTMVITDTILPEDGSGVKIVNEYTVTATPKTDWLFSNFTDAADVRIIGDTTVGQISGSSIRANFFEYTITINNPTTGGTVTSSASQEAIGHTVTLTASPLSEGYRLSALTGTYGEGEETLVFTTKTFETSTFEMPAGNVTITPVFEEVVTIGIGSTGGGSIEITRNGDPYGSDEIIVRPAAPYEITTATVDSGTVTLSDTEWGTDLIVYKITATPGID